MDLLVEKKYCEANTYRWIDEKKGHVGLIVAIIKELNAKAYLSKKPKSKEIVSIAKTTFGIDISIQSVKGTNKDEHNVDFIPYINKVK